MKFIHYGFLPKQFVADKIFCHGSEKGIESEQFKFKNVAMEDIQYIKKVPIMIRSTGEGDCPILG